MDYINNNGAQTSLVDEDDFFGNIFNPSGVKSTALTTPGRSDLHLDEYRQAFEDFIGSTIGEYSLEKARQSIGIFSRASRLSEQPQRGRRFGRPV